MTFGEKLSKLRKENNYTQEQLADILRVSRQSVSKWELDETYPETEKIIQLSKLFDCSVDYLLIEDITEKRATKNRVFTTKNKERAKKILKIAGIMVGILLAVDIVSMIIYFSVIGIPT